MFQWSCRNGYTWIIMFAYRSCPHSADYRSKSNDHALVACTAVTVSLWHRSPWQYPMTLPSWQVSVTESPWLCPNDHVFVVIYHDHVLGPLPNSYTPLTMPSWPHPSGHVTVTVHRPNGRATLITLFHQGWCGCAGGPGHFGLEQKGGQRLDYVQDVVRSARWPHVGRQAMPQHQVHTSARRPHHSWPGQYCWSQSSRHTMLVLLSFGQVSTASAIGHMLLVIWW